MGLRKIRKMLDDFCDSHFVCKGCPLNTPEFHCGRGQHFNTECPVSDDEALKAYMIAFNVKLNPNPYWERITQMADRQREKGISTYGQGLEQFTTPDASKRIDYIQEELIDALMYLEWLKEKLKGDNKNGTEEENT